MKANIAAVLAACLAWRSPLGLALALAVTGPALATDCHLVCRSQACKLLGPANKTVTFDDTKLRSEVSCESLTHDHGKLELRYRHKGRWFSPPAGVPERTALQTVFAKYPADPCGVPSPSCLQARMNGMVVTVGGHGIDSKESQPGGQGDPCMMGLPCGAIVPPLGMWSFRLVDAALSGTWAVKLARGTPAAGQPAEISARIERGVAAVTGDWFMPGAQYAYRFTDDAGRRHASGEFSVISRSTRDTLDTLKQRRIADGLSEGLAWSDTLAANNLDWDAYQLTLAQGELK